MSHSSPVRLLAEPTEADYRVIFEGINQYALGRGLNAASGSYFFAAYDEHNTMVAAISGFDNFGIVEIGGLWVKDSLRGQGYGTLLLQHAEGWGRQKQCRAIAVFTLKDWPAYTWYHKQSFRLEFERSGHANNTVGCYLIKNLAIN